jgi:catechol 2,3-dioxygenase-like lactoylglutathione lyase family enzyme
VTTFKSSTPNLLVRDIDASTRFYRDLLGFTINATVPDAAPFVFVWLTRDEVGVFLNDPKAVAEDFPGAAGRQPGGTCTMFFIVRGVDEYYAQVSGKAKVIMPIKTQFYGMREFAVEDPDGHIITFAEPVKQD